MGRELKSAGSNLRCEQQSLPGHSTASLNSSSPWRPLCPSTWWISKAQKSRRDLQVHFTKTEREVSSLSTTANPWLPGCVLPQGVRSASTAELEHCGFPSLPPSSHPATVPTEPPNNVLKLFLLFHIPLSTTALFASLQFLIHSVLAVFSFASFGSRLILTPNNL